MLFPAVLLQNSRRSGCASSSQTGLTHGRIAYLSSGSSPSSKRLQWVLISGNTPTPTENTIPDTAEWNHRQNQKALSCGSKGDLRSPGLRSWKEAIAIFPRSPLHRPSSVLSPYITFPFLNSHELQVINLFCNFISYNCHSMPAF